jgi:hypothetical protein
MKNGGLWDDAEKNEEAAVQDANEERSHQRVARSWLVLRCHLMITDSSWMATSPRMGFSQ